MSIATIFDVSFEGDFNLKLADRLSLITIVVPADIADKQQRLKAAGFASPEMEGLEEDVTLLTNYLIQQSFISTIRSIIKAIQLADRLKSVQRQEQRNQLIVMVNDFLRNLYSVKLVSQDGITISDNGDAVLKLFSQIVEEVFDASQGIAEEKLQEFLAKKQHEYVRLVLERARRLTSTIETIGSNQAANQRLEDLLNSIH